MTRLLTLAALALLALARPAAAQDIPAYPGALGWGAQAFNPCDRSNPVFYYIENTNDSGTGSLRDVLTSQIPDNTTSALHIVIPKVSGTIALSSRIGMRNKRCVYVALHAGPGDGIVIAGNLIRIEGGGDIVFRGGRSRFGGGYTAGGLNFIIGAGERIMLADWSMSWAGDTQLSINLFSECNTLGRTQSSWATTLSDLTIQNVLIGEGFHRDSDNTTYSTAAAAKGDIFAECDGVPQAWQTRNITFARTVTAHNTHRAPLLRTNNIEVVNTVVYNWDQAAAYTEGGKPAVDYIGNYFKCGPMSSGCGTSRAYGWPISHRFIFNLPGGAGTGSGGPEPDRYAVISKVLTPHDDPTRYGPEIYVSGNYSEGWREEANEGDNWAMVSRYRTETAYVTEVAHPTITGALAEEVIDPATGDVIPIRFHERRNTPPAFSDILTAQEAYELLVTDGEVGAWRMVRCDGSWESTGVQDAVDVRTLDDIRTGGGYSDGSQLPNTEADVGGYPSLSGGTVCASADSDADGLPNAFETRWGSMAPGDDPDEDGYSNAEEYLNGTDPTTPDTYSGDDGEPEPEPRVRRVFLLPLVEDYRGRMVPRGWSFDEVVSGRIYTLGDGNVLWVTYDPVEGEEALDETALDAACTTYSLDCEEIETVEIPGQPEEP